MNENMLPDSYDAMLEDTRLHRPANAERVNRCIIIPERYNWDSLRECFKAIENGESTADEMLDVLWTEQYERQRDVHVACDGSTYGDWLVVPEEKMEIADSD